MPLPKSVVYILLHCGVSVVVVRDLVTSSMSAVSQPLSCDGDSELETLANDMMDVSGECETAEVSDSASMTIATLMPLLSSAVTDSITCYKDAVLDTGCTESHMRHFTAQAATYFTSQVYPGLTLSLSDIIDSLTGNYVRHIHATSNFVQSRSNIYACASHWYAFYTCSINTDITHSYWYISKPVNINWKRWRHCLQLSCDERRVSLAVFGDPHLLIYTRRQRYDFQTCAFENETTTYLSNDYVTITGFNEDACDAMDISGCVNENGATFMTSVSDGRKSRGVPGTSILTCSHVFIVVIVLWKCSSASNICMDSCCQVTITFYDGSGSSRASFSADGADAVPGARTAFESAISMCMYSTSMALYC